MRRAFAIIAMLVLGAHFTIAQDVVTRRWNFRVVDAGQAPNSTVPLVWFQGETLDLTQTFRTNGLTLGLTNAQVVCVWEVAARTNASTLYILSTGTVVTATGATPTVRWVVSPSNANLAAGSYRGYTRALQSDGTNFVNIGVLSRQDITVVASPDSRYYDVVGPLSYSVAGDGGATGVVLSPTNAYSVVYSNSTRTLHLGIQTQAAASVTLGIGASEAFAGSWGATVSNRSDLALLAGNNASNAAQASLTNIVVQEGTSNAVVVAGRVATLTVRTNYAGGGAGTITNIASADGSVEVTDGGGPGVDLSVTNALAGYVRKTVTITNQAFQSTNGSVQVFQDVFGTFPYLWLGEANGRFAYWHIGATNRRALYVDDARGGQLVDLQYAPLPRSTNVLLTSGNYTNYVTSGGSQTPWTSAIDAGGYLLTNSPGVVANNTTNWTIYVGTNSYRIGPY